MSLLLFLLAASLSFNLLAVQKMRSRQQWKANYPLLDPELPKLTGAKNQRDAGIISFDMLKPRVESIIQKFMQGPPDERPRISVYVEDMNTGAWMGIAEREKFQPLSLNKVLLAISAMKKVDRGEWSIDQPFTLAARDMDTRPASPQWNKAAAGQQTTLNAVLKKLLVESDNTSFYLLGHAISDTDLIGAIRQIGLVYPEDPASPAISPKNYATIFRALYYSSYLSFGSSQHLLSLMNNSIHVYAIRAAVPIGIAVSHKVGMYFSRMPDERRADLYMHDVGIVYAEPSPFLIAVMTARLDQAESHEAIREITGAVFEFHRKYFE